MQIISRILQNTVEHSIIISHGSLEGLSPGRERIDEGRGFAKPSERQGKC